MYFDEDETERDPFEGFGELDTLDDEVANPADGAEPEAHAPRQEPRRAPARTKVKTAFSWAGFAGGVAALAWIACAIGGTLSYIGFDGALILDPALQAGLVALAIGPALLFWLAASAAGEALKARRLAAELTRLARDARLPTETGEAEAQRLSSTVRGEIESLNDAVAAALDRLGELETAARRNAALFDDAISASRENAEAMGDALARERDALSALNGDLKDQTEIIAQSVGRQVRLMREASKLTSTEIAAAETALEDHLASFHAAAGVMGERTASFQIAANDAAAATASLNGTMTNMLEGLAEATRLTETARKVGEQAAMAANDTAGAVRDTTRAAVFEAKRAAQLIRAETAAMQEAANDTLSRLQQAASAARAASEESQAAADRHAASIEKRLSALASVAGARKAAPVRAPEHVKERVQESVKERFVETPAVRKGEAVIELRSLQAAASAAVARASAPAVRAGGGQRNAFKGFGGWGSFAPRGEAPRPANESTPELMAFHAEPRNPDAALKLAAIDLVFKAGVDLDDVLQANDLEHIARRSRDGAGARRRAVADVAPAAVDRIARRLQRDASAGDLARRFHARPDLAKSESKSEDSELVRAYLLIDAALA